MSFLSYPTPHDVEEHDQVSESPAEIPLSSKLTVRFYLLLILHTSLKTVFRKAQALRMPDIETVPTEVFRTFVNKLAHICDSAKGPEKATAFAVLQLGTIRYYFTSNRRDEEDYQRTSHYVTGVLNTLGQATDHEVRTQDGNDGSLPVFFRLLRSIIGFNQSRIKGYIGHMAEVIDGCINAIQQDPLHGAHNALHCLQHIKPLLGFLEEGSSTIEEFVDGSQNVILAIHQVYTPSLKEFLRQRTQNNTDRKAPWVVVYHSIGRLLSYRHAVTILLAARRNWPQLFVDFEVHWFPSATPRPVSIPRGNRLNADTIIGKMTSNPTDIATYCGFIQDLENGGFPLNKTIISEAHNPHFLPYVHAEVNLLDNILRLPDNPQFFLDNRYIGPSKPTCRLCELFFIHHPSGVQVRESHKGLYNAWRMPDAFTAEEAEERKVLLNRIIPLVREEVFLSLKERCLFRRPNNSRDTPSSLPPEGLGSVYERVQVGGGEDRRWNMTEGVSMDDLVSNMGQMSVDDVGGDHRGLYFRSERLGSEGGEFEVYDGLDSYPG